MWRLHVLTNGDLYFLLISMGKICFHLPPLALHESRLGYEGQPPLSAPRELKVRGLADGPRGMLRMGLNWRPSGGEAWPTEPHAASPSLLMYSCFPHVLVGFPLGTLVSFHSPKTFRGELDNILPVGVSDVQTL